MPREPDNITQYNDSADEIQQRGLEDQMRDAFVEAMKDDEGFLAQVFDAYLANSLIGGGAYRTVDRWANQKLLEI